MVGEQSHKMENYEMEDYEMEDYEMENYELENESHEMENGESTKEEEVELEQLKLRDYQTELVAQALTGSNSLIIAPTGSGKTVVAVKICIEHMKIENGDKKVIFVCPTENLVSQQRKLFSKYIPCDQLQEMTGAIMQKSGIRREAYIEQTKMTFMTPQILVNIFRGGEFTIERISLMVFDECHHTRSEHPYNIIMNFYHDKLANSHVKPSLPQIVGMTASPGVEDAKDIEGACYSLVGLMANLDITQPPSVVRLHRDQLTHFTTDQNNVIICVEKNETQAMKLGVEQVMENIEEQIYYINGIETEEAKGTQEYEQWVIALHTEICEKESDPEISLLLVTYTEALRELNNGLNLNDHVNTKRSKQYLTEKLKLNQLRNNQAENNISHFYTERVSRTPDEDSPLLSSLYKLLGDEFHKLPQSRCIIFAKTKMVVSALVKCLNTESSLSDLELNVTELKGDDGKETGMTKAQQDKSLQDFREGKSKVMVATSVAEEGVDVAKCNLVIQYNYSTNHIGHTQRQGRKRAKESKSVVIAYEGSVHIRNDQTDRVKANLALDAADKLFHVNRDLLTFQVRQKQIESNVERKLVSQAREDAKSSTAVYDLDCARCKTHITKSDRIRLMGYSHYVAVDADICEKTTFSSSASKPVGYEERSIGKLLCGNFACKQELARMVIYNDVEVPILKISSFTVHAPGKSPSNPRRWKSCPFKVTVEIEKDDLLTLSGLFKD